MTKLCSNVWEMLNEEISEDNILRMSEFIALRETKFLIGYIGAPMVEIHRRLCVDIANRSNYKYVLSNSYEFVQEIAVFLCANMGRKLSDTYRVDKKGRNITIYMQAEREVGRLVNYKMRHLKTDTSLEELEESEMPTTEIQEDTTEEDYDVVDKIIVSLNLNEIQYKALQYRMNGMSYSQIAKEICRSLSTAYEYLKKVQKRYMYIYK